MIIYLMIPMVSICLSLTSVHVIQQESLKLQWAWLGVNQHYMLQKGIQTAVNARLITPPLVSNCERPVSDEVLKIEGDTKVLWVYACHGSDTPLYQLKNNAL